MEELSELPSDLTKLMNYRIRFGAAGGFFCFTGLIGIGQVAHGRVSFGDDGIVHSAVRLLVSCCSSSGHSGRHRSHKLRRSYKFRYGFSAVYHRRAGGCKLKLRTSLTRSYIHRRRRYGFLRHLNPVSCGT